MEELKVQNAEEVKKEENVKELATSADKKITNEKIESSLNYDTLSQEEKDAVDDFNKKHNQHLPITKSNVTIEFDKQPYCEPAAKAVITIEEEGE